MRIILVSDNPLFEEVIRESTTGCTCELFCMGSYSDIHGFATLQPELMILDETSLGDLAKELLWIACRFAPCRILLMNLINNDCNILDCASSALLDATALQQAMGLEVADL